jgi:hypothetical protein
MQDAQLGLHGPVTKTNELKPHVALDCIFPINCIDIWLDCYSRTYKVIEILLSSGVVEQSC